MSTTDKVAPIAVDPIVGHSSSFVVDVLSISSVTRPEVNRAQRSTWASHSIVRNFHVVTEDDDPDPTCYSNLTVADVYAQSSHCRSKSKLSKVNFLTQFAKTMFARRQWLQKKANPVGWACAQRRVAAGLAKLGRSYRKNKTVILPDYLVLVDDDTYINMNRFEGHLTNASLSTVGEVREYGTDSSAKVYAGCVVVAAPGQLISFTFPFGGWGTFFSKGAIQRLITPLFCNQTQQRDSFEEHACRRLHAGDDLLSESRYFKDGMSVSDLMGAQASKPGSYCLHSDWMVGYYVNFYNISGVRWDGPESARKWYPDAPQTRLHPAGSLDSFIYRKPGGNCKNDGGTCTSGSFACHYMSPKDMQRVHEEFNKLALHRSLTLIGRGINTMNI